MIRYLLTRVGLVIPTFLGVTLLTFAMIRLVPGDPVELRVGERVIDADRQATLRVELGLDRPLFEQYGLYLWDVLQGDLGRSAVTRKPVLEEFLTLFPATIELSVCALLLAILVGLPAGVLAATSQGRFLDRTVMATSLTGYSIPLFWWAILLIFAFSVTLGWTPVSGRISTVYAVEPVTGFMLIDTLLSDEPGAFKSAVRHLILPTIVLGTIPLAVISRMTRSAMLEVLDEDYVRTARANGLSPLRVTWVHALRNALIPLVRVIGLLVGVLLGGAILTETIFGWPGIGRWLIEAIGRGDYPALQGGVLLVATTVIFVSFVVDILYGVVNPRIRWTR